jgi:hypothetical protein
VRCARRKSRKVATEIFVVEKISSACFCFARTRGSCWSEILDFCFERKYKTIRCAMYSRR